MAIFDKTYFLCLLIAGLIFIPVFCKKQTHAFSIRVISSSRPFNAEYETSPLSEGGVKELKTALSQPYTYFARGGQAFIFFSEDEKYVIKFFKQKPFRKSWLLNHLPLPKLLHKYRSKKNWKREDKLFRDFHSYKVAFDEFRDKSGLLYIHLNQTNHLGTKLTFTDPLRIAHTIDLDKFDFIVQRRAENSLHHIEHSLEQKGVEGAEEAFRELLALISFRCLNGYRDRDPNPCTNCGFIEDKAIKIDVGRFLPCEAMRLPEHHNDEIHHVMKPLENWIKAFHPELLPALHKQIEEALL